MKNKIVFATALIASCFILFSFRGTAETKQDAEVLEVTNFSMPFRNFIEYKGYVYYVDSTDFLDGTGSFNNWRKDWMGTYSTTSSPSRDVSCEKMSETLEKY